MRTLLSVAAVAAAAVVTAAVARSAPAHPSAAVVPARHIVVAELFTSEGCSSCPPADALLQRISATSPVEGVEVIGLEEHVDYWDNLGWRDPFSSAAFTRRQSDYSDRVFRNGEIYTPQLVVDGAFEAIGSDGGAVRDAIVHAAARPAADVTVAARASGGQAHVEVSVRIPDSIARRKTTDIYVALVEDGLTTRVERGENHGRTLPHFAVVRSLKAIGSVPPQATAGSAAADIAFGQDWQPQRVRVIAFAQERDRLNVLGAGSTALSSAADR